jgi:hypothetical protein
MPSPLSVSVRSTVYENAVETKISVCGKSCRAYKILSPSAGYGQQKSGMVTQHEQLTRVLPFVVFKITRPLLSLIVATD